MTDGTQCPACGAHLSEDAVLCVVCGFHLIEGRRLPPGALEDSTEFSSANSSQHSFNTRPDGAPEENGEPASPYSPVAEHHLQSGEDTPLDTATAEKARRLADGALPIYISLLLMLCTCLPVLPFLTPLYAFRLWQWRAMYQSHSQLRQPNSLSSHVETELRFQAAGVRYLVSVICGIVAILLILAASLQFQSNP